MELKTESDDIVIKTLYASVRGLLAMNQVDVAELVYHQDWGSFKQELDHIANIEQYHLRTENARDWCERIGKLIRRISKQKRGL